jgi:O-antigen biosynthesis protein
MDALPLTTEILFALDGSGRWSADEPLLVLSGWCVGIGAPVCGIEADVDGGTHPVQRGLARPDVVAHHPHLTGAGTSGFRVALAISPGRHEITLRARRDGAPPVVLLQREFEFGFPALQGHIETPSQARVIAGRVRFSGWCFHPSARIVQLDLDIDGIAHECIYPVARPDVANAYASLPLAEQSGFELDVDLPPGEHRVTLRGRTDKGEILTREQSSIRVVAEPLGHRGARAIRRYAGAIAVIARHGCRWVRERGSLPHPRDWSRLARKAWHLGTATAAPGGLALPGGFEVPRIADRYDVWLELNRFTERRAAWLKTRLASAVSLPTISIVMPVHRPDRRWFERALTTIRAQVHDHWELCLADDASGDPALAAHLRELASRDPRIKVVLRTENGNISRATNSAAALATGDFLLFMDQDDELAPDALGEIALALAGAPDADILYTDDDKIDVSGRRYAPQFKPDWSPELLLSYMYMSHAFVVRRTLFAAHGGFRTGFEGSQDYDFALRAAEHARRIVHVPLVLYHWRALPGSTASSGAAKPASFAAGERAVAEALSRRGSHGKVMRPEWAVRAGVGIFSHEFPDDGPRVALLIPTKNHRDVLARCLDSLTRTSYRNYEVVVIDNDSDDPATRDYLARLSHRVLRISNPGPRFSFAHVNNEAARQVDADYLLFLNNDTEVRDPRWLSRMMGYAQLPGVGAVGARLLYADGRVQHAGVLHGYYDGLPGPAFKLAPATDHGYLSYAAVTRNYGAVTAACMLTPRHLFLEHGGFDGERYAVAYNDVDYGFRLEAAGYRCVYAAGAELLHHEGHSRGFSDDPRETAAYRSQYGNRYERYFNPNLSLADERFSIQPRRAFAAMPPGPVRALMCAFNLNWEGAPYSQFEMTAELKRRGILDPVVYAPADGPLRAAYESEGIAVHVAPHPLAGVTTGAEYDTALDRFATWIRTLDVGVVYGNTLQTFYAIDAAHRLALPSIWNPRESEPWRDYFRQYPDAVAARALACYAYPYRIVFVAHATADQSAALDTRHNFTVIHNGLDRRRLVAAAAGIDHATARRALGIAPTDIALLLLGTVCERKGQHDLAQALALLPDAVAQRVRSFIVGDRAGRYGAELHACVAALPEDRRSRVAIVPETGDVARFFVAADLFVCTSRVESYPRVILEAMAHGLPIVTTPVFGIREQVREDVNGLFYAPGDTAALASAIVRVVVDDALRSRFAANAVPALDSLTDFDAMVTRYGQIFKEATAP